MLNLETGSKWKIFESLQKINNICWKLSIVRNTDLKKIKNTHVCPNSSYKVRNRRCGNPTRHISLSFYDIQIFAALVGVYCFGHMFYDHEKIRTQDFDWFVTDHVFKKWVSVYFGDNSNAVNPITLKLCIGQWNVNRYLVKWYWFFFVLQRTCRWNRTNWFRLLWWNWTVNATFHLVWNFAELNT